MLTHWIVVLDAAAAVDILLDNERGHGACTHLEDAQLFSVAPLDAEVICALARLHRDEQLTAEAVSVRLAILADLDVARLPITGALLSAAWALRDNIPAREALYVAAAQTLTGKLLTTDDRLSRAAGDIAIDL
ncbi:MAG TPA: PIN domain-containing protein [Egibacteraceae bacterium]|nr:PIN domain-containing protein [Egibacteraceae bacterium]